MKKLFCLLLLLCIAATAQAAEITVYPLQGDVCIYVKNEKVGLMDANGNVVISAKYDYIQAFNDRDYTIAAIENNSGIISRTGEEILAPEWISIEFSPDGRLAIYYKNYDTQYLMDLTTGEVLIDGVRNTCIYFSGDYVCVMEYGEAHFGFEPPFITTVYDLVMNEISSLDAWVIRDFNPFSRAEFNDGKYGIVGADGTILIRGLEYISDFENGYAAYEREEQRDKGEKISICGLVDALGNVIECEGQSMKPAGEGLYIVKTNGQKYTIEGSDRYCYVNAEGEVIIPAEYQMAYAFVDGAAVVCRDDVYYLINTEGERISDLEWKWLEESYTLAVFEMPLVAVGVENGYRLANRQGEFVSDAVYKEIDTVTLRGDDDIPIFLVKTESETYYLLDMEGKRMLETAFTGYQWFGNEPGYIWLRIDEGLRRFDLKAREFVSDNCFSDVYIGDGVAYLNDEQKTLVQIDQDGNIIGPGWKNEDESGFF